MNSFFLCTSFHTHGSIARFSSSSSQGRDGDMQELYKTRDNNLIVSQHNKEKKVTSS